MPATKYVQSNLPVVPVGSELPKTTNLVLTISRNNFMTPLAVTIGDTLETPAQRANMLVAIGEYYAIRLAEVLNVLATYHTDAIYSIVSILEPYMETSQELDLRMPPISSRRVTINVTDRGRAKPDLYIE